MQECRKRRAAAAQDAPNSSAYLEECDLGFVKNRGQGFPHEVDHVLSHSQGAEQGKRCVGTIGCESGKQPHPTYAACNLLLTWKLPKTATRFCFSSARSSSVRVAAMGGAAVVAATATAGAAA